MKINAKIIKKLIPCKNRFDNYVYYYEHRDFEVHEFLNLDNITYDDKIWVMTRLLTTNQLAHWVIMCAESVKHLYSNAYPTNKCLDELFAYLHTITDFTRLTKHQKEECLRLRRRIDADSESASVAYNAAISARYAAHINPEFAFYAADYATDCYADPEEQRNLNLLHLTSVLEK